jgi:methyl coenzyme M reductase subunit D
MIEYKINRSARGIKTKNKMRKLESKKLLVGLTIMSMMCVTSAHDLYAQKTASENSVSEPELISMQNKTTKKWGYVNKRGKKVIPFKYEFAMEFCEGLAAVNLGGELKRAVISSEMSLIHIDVIGGKWGYIDETGKEVISFKYDKASGFHESLAIVGLNGKYGFIDKTGNEVMPCKYDSIYLTSTTTYGAGVRTTELMVSGFTISKMDEHLMSSTTQIFSEGLAAVRLNGKWGHVDKTGQEIISCKYDDKIGNFSNNMAQVKSDGKWGYIDQTGQEIIPCKYDYMGGFSNNMAQVKSDGKWGYIDQTGRELVPCKYDEIEHFSDDMAAVKSDGKWGYVDKIGKEVIPCTYDDAGWFNNGVAKVSLNGETFKIDKTGNKVE